MGALWSNCLLLYIYFLLFGEKPLGGRGNPRGCRTHILLPVFWLAWVQGPKGIDSFNMEIIQEQNLTFFLTSPQCAVQPSLPSMDSWKTSFNPSSLNCQWKAPAVGNREDRRENLPNMSLHLLSDLSKNFQLRFKKLKFELTATKSRQSVISNFRENTEASGSPKRHNLPNSFQYFLSQSSRGQLGLAGDRHLESNSNMTFLAFPSFHGSSLRIWGSWGCQLLKVLLRQHIVWTSALCLQQRGNVDFSSKASTTSQKKLLFNCTVTLKWIAHGTQVIWLVVSYVSW